MAAPFRPKTFPEILANSFAYGRSLLGPDIDLNPGSVLRTIFEIGALQDADQYLQIAKLLDLFSIDKAQGDDLDRRAQDFGSDYFTDLRRRPARTSISKIAVSDSAHTAFSKLLTDYPALTTSFSVQAGEGTRFTASGAVVLERGTEREEEVIYTRSGDVFTVVYPATGFTKSHPVSSDVARIATRSRLNAGVIIAAVTANLKIGTGSAWATSGIAIFEQGTLREEKRNFTRVGDVLTLSLGFTFAHDIDTDVTQGTSGSDRTVSSGTTCFAPATESTKQINFRTIAAGVLKDGELISSLISVESSDVGSETRTGANTITRFTSAPFANAVATNPIAATRGADKEGDQSYRQRIKDFIQSLTQGTALSIQTNVVGVRDESTNEEVAFAQIVEPVDPTTSPVLLYISDGTATFVLTQSIFIGRDILISDAEVGDKRGRLSRYGPFSKVLTPVASRTPRLFRSEFGSEATSVGVNYLEDTAQAMVVNDHSGKYLKSDDDQFYLIISNTAIRFVIDALGTVPSLGSYAIVDFSTDPLIPDTDYKFNESTGDVELVTALAAHECLLAASDGASPSVGAYTFTTGLGSTVTRKVNGDPSDLQTFPGMKAAGTKVIVIAPVVVSPVLTIRVVGQRGFSDEDLEDPVTQVTQTYVNSLGIGENVILSEIVRLVKGLSGVADVVMIDPKTNVVVPSGQIARITDANVVVV